MLDKGNEMELYGRKTIYAEDLTDGNLMRVVRKAINDHLGNYLEEDYLYWYRRGKTPIYERKKEVRPEICSKINVNHAHEVVSFKNGYFLQKPAFYRSRAKDEATISLVKQWNEFIYASGKQKADNKIVNAFHEMGVGVLYIAPNDDDEKPFVCYSLDPRENFVAYTRRPGNAPVFACHLATLGEEVFIDVTTEEFVYKFSTNVKIFQGVANQMLSTPLNLISKEPNIIGKINIIEYFYNEEKMSAFECAIPLMDAYNECESDRLDSIGQFVQSLCVATNCEFPKKEDGEDITANDIRKAGMLVLTSIEGAKADFQILSQVLDQSQTQVTLDNYYEQILDKCSMPSTTKGGASTSDTGTAVYLRDGWEKADTDARNTEDLFKESNERFDEVALAILKRRVSLKGFPLKLSDIELNIERNSSSNLLVKTQGALNMKELGFAPQIAFERSGLSTDPLNDIEVSEEYIERVWNDRDKGISTDTGNDKSGIEQRVSNPVEEGNE